MYPNSLYCAIIGVHRRVYYLTLLYSEWQKLRSFWPLSAIGLNEYLKTETNLQGVDAK